ncbi:MAG: hypothetical protein KA369_15370 [Spirochaetes bacterium]|nr:hypothetical protein [Spirochaetota bacterium]
MRPFTAFPKTAEALPIIADTGTGGSDRSMAPRKTRARRAFTAAIILVLAAFLSGCAARRVSNYQKFTDHVKKIQEINKKSCAAGCTLFEGDSNIELINVQDYLSEPACNYAYRGSTTRTLLDRREKVSLLKPARIVVLVGGNDLVAKLPSEDTYRNYDELLGYYKGVSKNVYCLSNLPVDPAIIIKNSTLVALNEQLERICRKRGVTYVNVYPHLLKNGGLNPDYAMDPVHLNKAGQDVLMDVLKKNLKK